MLIKADFLSTLLPVTGPAVEQFPTASQTCFVPVEALLVSVFAATLVLSVKLALLLSANPEPESPAEHEMLASVDNH